jgi:hypothetical protein
MTPPAQERTLCGWFAGYRIQPAMVFASPPKCSKLHRLMCIKEIPYRCPTLFAVERYLMDTNEKQIARSVLESLRADLIYAHLKNGSRILDVADLRQYIYALTGSPLKVNRIAKGLG